MTFPGPASRAVGGDRARRSSSSGGGSGSGSGSGVAAADDGAPVRGRPDATLCVQPVGSASCGRPAASGAPVALCDTHLAAAAEWAASASGVTDVLASPCLACGSRLGVRLPSGWLCAVCEWRVGEIPDDELAPVRVDVVYYLRFDDRIKIGTTANPRQRLAAIRHDELLAFERGGRMLERARHERFAALRLERSEWFRAGEELLAHVEALRAGVRSPWDALARWRSEALALRG